MNDFLGNVGFGIGISEAMLEVGSSKDSSVDLFLRADVLLF